MMTYKSKHDQRNYFNFRKESDQYMKLCELHFQSSQITLESFKKTLNKI